MDELSFSDLPSEIHSVIFDFLPTKDIFDLMLVSKQIKNMLEQDERFWRKRIKIHFSEKRITFHQTNGIHGLSLYPKGTRFLLINMIRSPQSVIYIQQTFNKIFQKRWHLDISGVHAIQKTISKYITLTSLEPYDKFMEIIKRDIPNSIGNVWKMHDLIMEGFRSQESRTPLIFLFFVTMDRSFYLHRVIPKDRVIVTDVDLYKILDIMLISVEQENPLLKLLDKQMNGMDRHICEQYCQHVLCKVRSQKCLDLEF